MFKFEPSHTVVQNAKIRMSTELSERYNLEQIESNIALCISANALQGHCRVLLTYDGCELVSLENDEIYIKCSKVSDCQLLYRYFSAKLNELNYDTEYDVCEATKVKTSNYPALKLDIRWYDTL